MSRIESITVTRHLKDVNDLRCYGTDNPLAQNQESDILSFGRALAEQALTEGYKGVALITSPKRRAQQTAILIQQGITEMYGELKVPILTNHNIRELDQGDFVIPPDYVAGEHFEPLSLAWEAFWKETFIDHKNVLYRFGDPVSQGELRYPELQGHFSSYGESYRDYAVRLYTAVRDFGKRLNRFERVKPVVVTHASPQVIFQELEHIATEIQAGNICFKPGELPQLTWDTYLTHGATGRNFGETLVLTPKALLDPMVSSILEKEILVLSQM